MTCSKNLPLEGLSLCRLVAGLCLCKRAAVSFPSLDGRAEARAPAEGPWCPHPTGGAARGDPRGHLSALWNRSPWPECLQEADRAWQKSRKVSGVSGPDPAMQGSSVCPYEVFSVLNYKPAFTLGGFCTQAQVSCFFERRESVGPCGSADRSRAVCFPELRLTFSRHRASRASCRPPTLRPVSPAIYSHPCAVFFCHSRGTPVCVSPLARERRPPPHPSLASHPPRPAPEPTTTAGES